MATPAVRDGRSTRGMPCRRCGGKCGHPASCRPSSRRSFPEFEEQGDVAPAAAIIPDRAHVLGATAVTTELPGSAWDVRTDEVASGLSQTLFINAVVMICLGGGQVWHAECIKGGWNQMVNAILTAASRAVVARRVASRGVDGLFRVATYEVWRALRREAGPVATVSF